MEMEGQSGQVIRVKLINGDKDEGKIFQVDLKVIKMSVVFEKYLEKLNPEDIDFISVYDVDENLFQKVIEWGDYHKNNSSSLSSDQEVTFFDSCDPKTLAGLFAASQVLEIPELSHDLKKHDEVNPKEVLDKSLTSDSFDDCGNKSTDCDCQGTQEEENTVVSSCPFGMCSSHGLIFGRVFSYGGC